ncbi:MAG: discoidin domain-containing protein, partial [Fibrobacteria bacterium]|nr:discoidin domain-containing protein [Fibrobacteria bacterium]
VKFHEWQGFAIADTLSEKPELTVKVRSEEAGLKPSSVECYYTNDYKGRWTANNKGIKETQWTKVDCSCSGEDNTKEWQTITVADFPVVVGGVNRVRFKIQDMYTGSYYRGPRWSRKEYVVPTPVNLALNKPASSPFSHPGQLPSKGIDGNIKTYWFSVDSVKMPWLQVDLEKAHKIGAVSITDCHVDDFVESRTNFEIRASNDSDFTESIVLASKTGESYPMRGTLVLQVADTGSYRYIRLQRLNDAGQIIFGNFGVYGALKSLQVVARKRIPTVNPYHIRKVGNDMIVVSGAGTMVNVDVYDVRGNLVLSSEGPRVDVDGLRPGAYLVRVRGTKFQPLVFAKVK